MPIYEFYCSDCHWVFNFMARRPNVTKRPACPRCERPQLERKVSRFAIAKGLADPVEGADGMDLPPGMDEARMERVMMEMAGDIESVNEDDPRQMAGMMRKFCDRTGLHLGDAMEEAMRRMEAGEDPDAVEAEMGDLLEGDDMTFEGAKPNLKTMARRLRPPRVDDNLYEL